MAKRFNGRKMSHGAARMTHSRCAICDNSLMVFRGTLRCTEIRKSRRGNNSYRVIKHGSLATIKKRLARAA